MHENRARNTIEFRARFQTLIETMDGDRFMISLGQIWSVWFWSLILKNGRTRCFTSSYEMGGHPELATLEKYFSPDD